MKNLKQQFHLELTAQAYFDKYVKIASRTETMDQNLCRDLIKKLYNIIDLPCPKNVVFVKSPNEIKDKLGGKLRGKLWIKLSDKLYDKLWDKLYDKLGDKLWDKLAGNLWDKLGDKLSDKLRDKLLPLNFWTNWVAFYEYALKEVFPEDQKEFPEFMQYLDIIKEFHIIAESEDGETVYLVDFPKEIDIENMELVYRDGFEAG